MTAMSISALLCVSTASALLQQGINTQCDLGSAAPGSDVSCAASVEYIDNVVGSTDAIESTVTFSFLGGECWNPRISYQFRETDFADGDEFISLFQRGPTSAAGHMIVEGDGVDETYGAIKNAECALDTATDGSVTNDYGSKIGVQCCNDVDDATEAYREELGCVSGVTFAAAEQLCTSKGYRLCTQGEVQNGLGYGIGCSFNAYHVWTSTECRGTAITQCGDSGAATDCDSMTTCADLMVLPDGEDIGAAPSVDIVVYVSEDVDGLHHAADDGAICANEPYAYNVESFLTLTCQTPTEAPTPAPTNDPSPAPTRAPSPQPTHAPTAQPTASPTTAMPTTGAPTMDGCDFSYLDYVETCHAGQDWHWIANGDGDDEDESEYGINKADECMVDNSRNTIQENDFGNVIATQCCSNDGLTPYREKTAGGDTCTAAKGLTFSEAEQYCADAGYRLCTRAEIAMIGADNWHGCSFDAFLVWTSDPCGPSARDAPTGCDVSYSITVDTCQAGQDWHWLADGDGNDENESIYGINKADECMVDNSRNSIQKNNYGNVIATQCCSNDGLSPYREKTNTDDVCTAAKGLTFSEAEQYCADVGHRLCSRAEIAAIGPGKWQGCSFDVFLVWTSDPCGPSAPESAAHAPKLSFPAADPVTSSPAVTIDLSSKWMASAVVMYSMAMALAGAMCYKARSERLRTKKYTKVIAVDSEDFSENEARAINVE